MLPALTEYGFLPVPPIMHLVALGELPGCFGAKPRRADLWQSFLNFVEWLNANTPIKTIYLDGRFLSASDDVTEIEVGIELTTDLVRRMSLPTLRVPFREEYSVRVRYFAPSRPEQYNFHEEFQTPDPEIRLREAPADIRKGYIRINL